MLERDIERHLVEMCRAQGWLCWKFTSPGTAGVPDRIILADNGYHCFVELKTPQGKLSRLQIEIHKRLRDRGHEVYTINSKYQVRELVGRIRNEIKNLQARR